MKTIKGILLSRDGMAAENADDLIQAAKEDLGQRLLDGDLPFDICEEWFGLEPDYLEELISYQRGTRDDS